MHMTVIWSRENKGLSFHTARVCPLSVASMCKIIKTDEVNLCFLCILRVQFLHMKADYKNVQNRAQTKPLWQRASSNRRQHHSDWICGIFGTSLWTKWMCEWVHSQNTTQIETKILFNYRANVKTCQFSRITTEIQTNINKSTCL